MATASSSAVGVVLGGGGGRGLGHLGVLRALEAGGLPPDIVGGCSQGAFMAAAYALPKRTADRLDSGQEKRAKFPTSKAHISAVFRSFWLTFGRAIISWNGLEAWMLFPERARAEHSR